MHIESSMRADGAIARMAGELTIYEAAQVKPQLIDLVDANASLELDLSGVSSIDTTGIQLLLLAKRHAVGAGKNIRLSGHSAAVLELLDLYDLAAAFGDPIIETASSTKEAS